VPACRPCQSLWASSSGSGDNHPLAVRNGELHLELAVCNGEATIPFAVRNRQLRCRAGALPEGRAGSTERDQAKPFTRPTLRRDPWLRSLYLPRSANVYGDGHFLSKAAIVKDKNLEAVFASKVLSGLVLDAHAGSFDSVALLPIGVGITGD